MNSILMRYPNGLSKAITLSYDDAVTEDIRLIEIMKKHGLRGTFNINSSQYVESDFVYPPEKKWGRRMTWDYAKALYSQDGIEPALHGFTHSILTTQPSAQMTYEIIRDRESLEKQFGKIVRGMAYPFGAYNDTVCQVLKDCGITYCRATDSTHRFDLPTDWLRWNPTCHHADPRLPELAEKFLNQNRPLWQTSRLLYVWGHAYEFEQYDNWSLIEAFAEQVGNREDVWYATNMEIYEYVEAFQRLVFTLDQKIVTNPTATTLWFHLHEKLYVIQPGETLHLA